MSDNNKKFFGEMTKEEFREALKIILADDKDKRSFVEKIKDSFKELWDFIKYIVTFRFVFEIIEWFKNLHPIKDFLKFVDDVKYIVTFQFWKDFVVWYKTPLTQDVFIKRGKKFKAFIEELIDTLIFVIVFVIIIRFFIGEIRWIPSGSMRPTLLEGDRIVVERYSRFYEKPKRGDIMVFYPPSTKLSNAPLPLFARLTGIFCKDVAYIKRVIGLPGDKIEVKFEQDGSAYVWINDEKYEEDYIKSPYEYPQCPPAYASEYYLLSNQVMKCGPFYLGDNDYFMMGDNRGNSQDSRYWGTLSGDRFIGKAVSVFWPLNRVKSLRNKLNQ